MYHDNMADHQDLFVLNKGLNEAVVKEISLQKNEPWWMTEFRLQALAIFEAMPMPIWGPDLSALNHNDIHYYVKSIDQQQHSWDAVPSNIKDTFMRLGIPQAEQEFLAGVGAQYESEMVYKKLKRTWQEKGVVFIDTGTAMITHEELFRRYFGTVIPMNDNKFAALNTAVWSGGSFIYVPPGVEIDMPLQAYFRINRPQMGQFERTLIIADKGSKVHYIEGCSAPLYRTSSLHSAVVELIALPGAHIRYTTIQNWSNNVYNLVTKRAVAYAGSRVEWVDGNFGSKVTMKYPCIILKEPEASGQILSIAVANNYQHQDAGGKIIHLAPRTSSHILSKSISKNGGRATYRGLIKVVKGAINTRSFVQCDALLLDAESRSDTYPTIQVKEPQSAVGHEASVSAIDEEQLFYLSSRGINAQSARTMIINGFIDVFVKELPMEYAVEINRLIAMEMEGSIG